MEIWEAVMTPQTQLTLSKVFENKEIRAIEYKGEVWIPIVDIAEAWGLDRSNIAKIINRNPEVFAGLSTVVDITSSSQNLPNPELLNNSLRLVNEQGVYVLALKVSAGRIKNKEVKATIIRFQRWVPELIQQFHKGELVSQSQFKSPIDITNHYLDLADIAVKRSGVPKEIAHGQAWALSATATGLEINTAIASYIKAQSQQLMLPEGIPQDKKDYDMYFSLTKVAASLKLPIDKVRNVLESLNIIYFENGYWKLTAHGMQYGKVFMVTPGYPYRANQKAYIKYNPMAIDLLKKYFAVDTTVLGIPETKVG
jgi:prophage antirepressor-like protein